MARITSGVTDTVSDDEFAKKARGEAIRIKTFLILTSNKYVLYLYMTLYSMYTPDKSSRRSCIKRRLFIVQYFCSAIRVNMNDALRFWCAGYTFMNNNIKRMYVCLKAEYFTQFRGCKLFRAFYI
jgi:hypothetical protein